jgi:hypothetical protein
VPDASDKVTYHEWRLVRMDPEECRWPFMYMDVGEAFVEGDLSKWASLRVRASKLRARFLDYSMERCWSVRKETHNGEEVIVVRRTQ